MIDRYQIQRFTSNFPNLQGLKSVPVSLWLLLITVWANQQYGETRDLTLPLLISFAMILFYWFVHQYYRLTFGEIRQTSQKKVSEVLKSGLAGILALAAFYFDTALDLPFSLSGILWVLLLVFDSIRIQRAFPQKPFAFFWILAALLFMICILPVFGLQRWWLDVGIQTQMNAILIIVSLVIFLYGILWHFLLLRNMEIKADDG